MGVLPLQFKTGDDWQQLNLSGDETFDILGVSPDLAPQQNLTLVIHSANQASRQIELLLRIDTPIEVDYFLHAAVAN